MRTDGIGSEEREREGKKAHHAELNLTLNTCLCASGPSDVQEDHSEEQRQEEEDVRGLYGDAAAPHVTGGLFEFCSHVCSVHVR